MLKFKNYIYVVHALMWSQINPGQPPQGILIFLTCCIQPKLILSDCLIKGLKFYSQNMPQAHSTFLTMQLRKRQFAMLLHVLEMVQKVISEGLTEQ